MMSRPMLRRTFLRGATGAVVGLPLLLSSPRSDAGPRSGDPPKRFITIFIPNGVVPSAWFPTAGATEKDFQLAESMVSLEPHRDRLLVLRGVHLQSIDPTGDDHQQGMASVLTGRPPFGPSEEANFAGGGCNCAAGWGSGISIDQAIAEQIGTTTPLKSVELGVMALAGGLNGASTRTILSYSGPSEPMFATDDPNQVFDRMFGNFVPKPGGEAPDLQRLRAQRKSVLDTVLGELSVVRNRVGPGDRARIDRHTDLIRSLEHRVTAVTQPPSAECVVPASPTGGLDLYLDENLPALSRIQLDLLVAAMTCDITRVATFMYSTSNGSPRMPFPPVESYYDGHELGHQAIDDGRPEALEFARKVTWYVGELAYLLDQLASIPEGAGSLLDNTLVLFVSENATGQHETLNMPFLLAGNVGGYFDTGRYLDYGGVSHNDLLVSIQNAFGIASTSFGSEEHCTGPLPGLKA